MWSVSWWRAWRAHRRRERAVRAALDTLFSTPSLMAAARLAPRHRHRMNVLEVDEENGVVRSLVLGIVRHPRAHPLAVRGDEVAEILEYVPGETRVQVIGSRNLTRHGRSK